MFEPVEPRWAGPVTVLASGPSLRAHPQDIETARAHTRVIVVCDTWRLCRDADLLYACDWPWWVYHRGVPEFCGEKWVQSNPGGGIRAMPKEFGPWGLRVVKATIGLQLSLDPAAIGTGGNSGFQALNLALHLTGWEHPVYLLGFDLGKGHSFPDRNARFNSREDYSAYAESFIMAAQQTDRIVNCSRETVLECFPRMSIEEALCQ